MADIDVATSNAIFQTLEEWNTLLQAENIKLSANSRPPPGGPRRRGPSP